jgi:hypothetical protein
LAVLERRSQAHRSPASVCQRVQMETVVRAKGRRLRRTCPALELFGTVDHS